MAGLLEGGVAVTHILPLQPLLVNTFHLLSSIARARGCCVPYPQRSRCQPIALGKATCCLHALKVLLAVPARPDLHPASARIDAVVAVQPQQVSCLAVQAPVGAAAADITSVVGPGHQNGPAVCSATLRLRGGISHTFARSLPISLVRTSWRLTT